MFNKDLLHKLWIESKIPLDNVTLEEIGEFAKQNKSKLNYKSEKNNEITQSGLYYAVLKFIWCYSEPIGWDIYEFDHAKDSYAGQYDIWKKHLTYKVNISKNKIRK